MGRKTYFSIMNSNLPLRPFTQVLTKKKFNRGYMLNGIHHDNWVQGEVYLDVSCRGNPIKCSSCGRVIEQGEIYGNGQFYFIGKHCSNCIEMPESVEVWNISYPMKRKSRNHPDGINAFFIVAQSHKVETYIEELKSALEGRPVSTIKIVPPAVNITAGVNMAAEIRG